MSGHSSFALSLSSIHIHSRVSLLKMVDSLLYIMLPLKMIQCLSFPSIDINITLLLIDFQGILESLLPILRAVTISVLGCSSVICSQR